MGQRHHDFAADGNSADTAAALSAVNLVMGESTMDARVNSTSVKCKPVGEIDSLQQTRQILYLNRIVQAVCISLCVVSAVPHAIGAQSTFETDPEGWIVADWNNPDLSAIVGTYAVAWNASGGNPGGYISASDPSGQWFWFSAPAKFLGNQSAAFGSSLQYDVFVDPTAGRPFPVVMLTGDGQRLFFEGGSPTAAFASYSVPMTPKGWRLNDWQGGAEPTDLQMQTVLGSLDGLYISGDWFAGDEVAGLDNVRFGTEPSVVPEPCTSALLLLGGLPLVMLSRRRIN